VSTHSIQPPPSLWKTLRRLLRTFGPDLWAERHRLLLSYLYTLLAVGALLLVPWPLQMIIDYVLARQPLPIGFLNRFAADYQVLLLGAAIIGIALLRVTFIALEKNTSARVRESVTVALRDRLLMHTQSLPPATQLQQRSGELVMRLVEDVSLFVRVLTKALPVTINHTLTTFGTLAVMFWLEPRLALVGAGVLIVIVVLARRYTGPLHSASRSKRQLEGQVSGLAQEIIRSLPTTQALGLEQHTQARFRDFNNRSLHAGVQEVRVAVDMERTMALTRSLALAMISAGGAMLVLRDAFSIGELTVFLTYMSQLLRPAEKANEQVASIIRGVTRGEKLLHLLDQYPLVADRPGAVELQRARGSIELRSVSFAYPDTGTDSPQQQDILLNNISLRIEPGSLCVLVGASGSGKSTLLNLLLRMYEPLDGEIRLDGMPLQTITLRSLRRQFAVVVQHTHLFAGTLREALSGTRAHPEAQLWQALQQVALVDTVRALPGGLDAPLGEDGLNLSGGQRARLSIARAFLLDRPILLLDEPTANVDPVSRELILDVLDRIRRGRTCIVVTHQPEVMRRADRVLHLIKGRLGVEAPAGDRFEHTG
jgi:ATP-binding cassette subfamily B protein